MRDICELLAAVGLRPPAGRLDLRVAYHDPCHLINVQKISSAPRQLLRQIPGITLVDLPESDLCCGAAGTYSLSHPAMSHRLGQRKAENIGKLNVDVCATANVGCELQIRRHLGDEPIAVIHVISLLARSYRNA